MISFSIDFKVPNVPLFNGGGPKIVHEEFSQALNAGVLQFQGAILPLVPVNNGILRQGVQTSVTGQGTTLVGRVFDPVAYAIPVELGSRPHFPPVAPIQLWVRRKLGVPEKDVKSVAFLIARAISRRGTKAVKFFERGFQATKGQVEARFERAAAKVVERLVGGA